MGADIARARVLRERVDKQLEKWESYIKELFEDAHADDAPPPLLITKDDILNAIRKMKNRPCANHSEILKLFSDSPEFQNQWYYY